MSDYVSREEAEEMIRDALDDYLFEGTLQEILEIIHPGEYIVSESNDLDEEVDNDIDDD